MKIGFLSAFRGQKQYAKQYEAIVGCLRKKGHEVISNLDIKLETVIALKYHEREKVFLDFYERLEDCAFVFAECSMQSTQVGFGISYLRCKGKAVILLSQKGIGTEFLPNFNFSSDGVYSNLESMMVTEYTDDSISSVISEALSYMEPRLDKRFTIIFPASLMAEMEEEARKKKLPKAVYIRQLIEKELTSGEKK